MSLHSKYIKEREDIDCIEVNHGFITYKKLNKDVYYIIDVYIEKEHRRNGFATDLENLVRDKALEDGAIALQGSVCLSANNVTESMLTLLNSGYRYMSANGNMLYFIKKIGV